MYCISTLCFMQISVWVDIRLKKIAVVCNATNFVRWRIDLEKAVRRYSVFINYTKIEYFAGQRNRGFTFCHIFVSQLYQFVVFGGFKVSVVARYCLLKFVI